MTYLKLFVLGQPRLECAVDQTLASHSEGGTSALDGRYHGTELREHEP